MNSTTQKIGRVLWATGLAVASFFVGVALANGSLVQWLFHKSLLEVFVVVALGGVGSYLVNRRVEKS